MYNSAPFSIIEGSANLGFWPSLCHYWSIKLSFLLEKRIKLVQWNAFSFGSLQDTYSQSWKKMFSFSWLLIGILKANWSAEHNEWKNQLLCVDEARYQYPRAFFNVGEDDWISKIWCFCTTDLVKNQLFVWLLQLDLRFIGVRPRWNLHSDPPAFHKTGWNKKRWSYVV